MGYRRVNITLPPDLWVDVQNYLEEHDQTLSRLVQSLLSSHIRTHHHEKYSVQSGEFSEERVREIVAEMIGTALSPQNTEHPLDNQELETRTDPPLPITDPSFALSRYPDPVGLAAQLETWLSENRVSAREFQRRYGISLANKNRWVRGGGTTQATADAILAIISRPPDRSGSEH